MLKILGVSKSGYYAWLNRKPSKRSIHKEKVKEAIKKIYDESKCIYGAPKITAELKKMGFKTAAMALCENSVGMDAPELKAEDRLAIVLGTEGDGLAARTIADCDYTVRIPMAAGVDSLNVAAASAVAFWELRSGT